MRRRIARMDPFLDARLEPIRDAVRRAKVCGELRRMWQAGTAEPWRLRQIATRLGVTVKSLVSCFNIALSGRSHGTDVPNRHADAGDALPGFLPELHGCRTFGRVALRPYFGAGWARIEQQSAILQRRLVPLENLPAEMERASRYAASLRCRVMVSRDVVMNISEAASPLHG
jgi:hypothetical protein